MRAAQRLLPNQFKETLQPLFWCQSISGISHQEGHYHQQRATASLGLGEAWVTCIQGTLAFSRTETFVGLPVIANTCFSWPVNSLFFATMFPKAGQLVSSKQASENTSLGDGNAQHCTFVHLTAVHTNRALTEKTKQCHKWMNTMFDESDPHMQVSSPSKAAMWRNVNQYQKNIAVPTSIWPLVASSVPAPSARYL